MFLVGGDLQTPANTDSQAVLSELDEQIAKLKRLRELLADSTVWALVRHTWPVHTAPVARRRRADGRQYGGIVQAAYECVLKMNGELFTKSELAERVRATGYEIREHRHAMYYAVQKFLRDGVIELIERGGGKRPNKYQRVVTTHAEPNTCAEQLKDSAPPLTPINLPKGSAYRSKLMKTSFDRIQQFAQPFTPRHLIRAVESAGYHFILSPESSIESVLRKLVKDGFLIVVREQSGDEPALYERRCADSPVPSPQP